MTRVLRKFAQTGFTLVELLIVVVILAILAAIVILQFSSSANDARESALDVNLNSMRSAIELYKLQHGVYPGAVTAGGAGAACGGTAGTGTGGTGPTGSQAMMDQLTLFSNEAGQTCTLNTASAFRFGPYLRRGIPNDPITGLGSAVGNITTTAAGTPLSADGTVGGWSYDTLSGQIIMNSSKTDSGNAITYAAH